MLRIKQRQSGVYTLTAQAIDEEGQPQTIDGPYGVTVTDSAGTILVTDAATYNEGILTYLLAASDIPHLDTYTVTWTGTVDGNEWSWATEIEVVGGYLFEISDLRGEDRAFTDATKYPSDALRAIRTIVEDTMESPRAAGLAFVPRGKRITIDGNDASFLIVPDYALRSVVSVKINGVALTGEEVATLTVDDDAVHAPFIWPAGNRNIEIHYIYGLDRAPTPITRAALMLAREYLVKSDLPGRATATSIGDQWFRVTIAGRDGVTGLPEVDAAINQFGRKSFRIV